MPGKKKTVKKTSAKKQLKIAEESAKKTVPNNRLPSVWGLLQKSWLELSTFWWPLVGIVAVYALLYFIFVMGFSLASSLQSSGYSSESKMVQVVYSVVDALDQAYGGGTESDAIILIQALLFLIASLALVWALRKLQALKTITIRDAYYQGPASLIPVILVSLVLVLCLLPALLGASVLTIALQAQTVGLFTGIAIVIALLLLFATMLLFVRYWPAFYIAALPNIRPIKALRSAALLTKKRRLALMRKIGALIAMAVLLFVVLIVPIALISAVLVPYAVYVVLFALFLFVQVYLYELYRSML